MKKIETIVFGVLIIFAGAQFLLLAGMTLLTIIR